jgi:hypothetical protein
MTVWWIGGTVWFLFIGSLLPGKSAAPKSRIACALFVTVFLFLLIFTVRYEAGIRPDRYDPEPKQPTTEDDAREFQV